MRSERRALIVAAASPQQLTGIETRPDVVIAADSGLHAVLAAGWIPDHLVGDLDSADPSAVEIAKRYIEVATLHSSIFKFNIICIWSIFLNKIR